MSVTDELLKQIKESRDLDAIIRSNEQSFINFSLSEYIEKIIKEKGLKKSDIITQADFDKTYAYQVFNGTKIPSRKKLLQLCIGMRLTVEETQTLLKYANYAQLYSRIKFDSIIIYALENRINISDVNVRLNEYNLEEFDKKNG